MKDFVVIFSKDGGKVVKGDLSAYKGNPNVLFNPSLEKVRTVPPHLWSKVGDTIVGPEEVVKARRHYNYYKYLIPTVMFILGFLCSLILKKN